MREDKATHKTSELSHCFFFFLSSVSLNYQEFRLARLGSNSEIELQNIIIITIIVIVAVSKAPQRMLKLAH